MRTNVRSCTSGARFTRQQSPASHPRALATPALALALLALAGCAGGSSGTTKTAASTAPASRSATTTATTTSTSAAPVGSSAAGSRLAGATKGSLAATTSASKGSIALTTSATSGTAGTALPGSVAATTTSATAGSGAPATGAASTAAGFLLPATLKGTIPADPDTSFVGTLFFEGSRIEPGTNVLVSFGGTTVALLSGTVYSSETVGASASFLTAGDYTFTLVSAIGTQSNPITVTVKAAAANGSWLTETPDVSMMFPPQLDTSFVGVVWIMGDHFLPGAMLLCTRPGYPDGYFALDFVNDRSLSWDTATPLAGDMTLSVVNPTTLASKPITVHVADVSATAASSTPGSVSPAGPAPQVLLGPTSCQSPFLGTEKIYGQNFLVGASIVVVDSTGAATTSAGLFLSSDEVWWELVYPASGTYTVTVTNPDGQSTKPFTFTVN